jgi:hypothetical protein
VRSMGGIARACVLVVSVGVSVAAGQGVADAGTSGLQMGFEWFPAQVSASGSLHTYDPPGVVVRSSVRSGGSLPRVHGFSDDSAVHFPAASSTAQPRAILTVTPDGSSDPLNPGGGDFSFGADFNLDQQSTGSQDNGDNLMQRGLFADRGQWKLQVDHGLVSCRIKGDLNSVVAKVYPTVVRGAWYRAGCARHGDTITATLQRLGRAGVESTSVTCRLGLVDTSGYPMSIGGKANRTGTAVSGNSDQFNGAVDNVHFELN